MVGEGEQVAVVDHKACGGRPGRVGVPVLLGRRRIDLRQEPGDGRCDRIGPAEGPDQARLGRRVPLLVRHLLPDPGHPGGLRPEAGVRPVRIFCQHVVRAQEGLVPVAEEGLHVPRMAGPVHQPGRLEGRVVEVVDADMLRHLAPDRLIFIRRHRAVQRHDQPVPGALCRVLVGRVDRHGADHVEVALQLLPEVARREVQVQRQNLALKDVPALPVAFLQVPADEAADVLDLALPVLGHLHVFGMGLRCHDRLRQALQQDAPHDGPVLPVLLEPAAAFRYDQPAVILRPQRAVVYV